MKELNWQDLDLDPKLKLVTRALSNRILCLESTLAVFCPPAFSIYEKTLEGVLNKQENN